MALQIANPVVVAKVERLARATGLTKTAVVERAIDRLASEMQSTADQGRMAALLAQLDRVPERSDAFDPLEWDDLGLPHWVAKAGSVQSRLSSSTEKGS